MLTSVSGYYNGTQIVMDEAIDIPKGQKVIITILNNVQSTADNREIDLHKYTGRGKQMFGSKIGVDDYIKGLRENDRV
ncbi:hypothetical protein [Ruminococcus sp.]|uniref:hypothetical protein n=1 Tax=Ruminococcus sp. TaxID=41978 RepID=UPI0025CDE73B|nr:hypothetical protein [Ruminococcus sp.]MBR1433087.1 hypothetical protein [Ruminococcus sp.]